MIQTHLLVDNCVYKMFIYTERHIMVEPNLRSSITVMYKENNLVLTFLYIRECHTWVVSF